MSRTQELRKRFSSMSLDERRNALLKFKIDWSRINPEDYVERLITATHTKELTPPRGRPTLEVDHYQALAEASATPTVLNAVLRAHSRSYYDRANVVKQSNAGRQGSGP